MILIPKAKVVIGIQARSNSTRFPQKIYQPIGKKMVITHVVDAAKSAKLYCERSTHKVEISCEIAILYPKGDHQVFSSCRSFCQNFIEAPNENENDVLARYLKAMEDMKADYIVRITSDCPLILDFVISKHINVAVMNQIDYVSNVYEDFRFSFDGLDVEVISRRGMEWLRNNVTEDYDREHVTTLLRKKMPHNLKFGFISHKLDSSSMKLSLDTPEDLENIRKYYHEKEFKLTLSHQTFGRKSIYEI